MLLWVPTSISKFLIRRGGRPSHGPAGRILRPGIGTRCGRRGSASANDLPDRHKAGPRHKGRSQLSGWSCRGWQGRPTSSSARGSLTPDTPGRAFSLIGLGTNGLGSRSSDPGNAVCVHACSSPGPANSAMSVRVRAQCRFPAPLDLGLDEACKKSNSGTAEIESPEIMASGDCGRSVEGFRTPRLNVRRSWPPEFPGHTQRPRPTDRPLSMSVTHKSSYRD